LVIETNLQALTSEIFSDIAHCESLRQCNEFAPNLN